MLVRVLLILLPCSVARAEGQLQEQGAIAAAAVPNVAPLPIASRISITRRVRALGASRQFDSRQTGRSCPGIA